MFKVLLFGFFLIKCVYTKTITITWTAPETAPANGADTLKAIDRHMFALHAASYVPRLLGIQNSVTVKVCPPLPNDPLINEFTVPRIAAYSLLYDHECIQNSRSMSPTWGSKPKEPAPETPKKERKFHATGLTVPQFTRELRKLAKNNSDNSDFDAIWLIDSDSLRGWFKGHLLRSLYDRDATKVPAHDLMRQINVMYSETPDNSLKGLPQAVQGALVVVLPNYLEWNNRFDIKKHVFNPTWWSTRFVPQSKRRIFELLKDAIDKVRSTNQLVIVVHDPTTFNTELISSLTLLYGKDSLVSASKMLPKQTTTLQLLQFIQKAAAVILDSRDQLGQSSLLTLGFSKRVHLLQTELGPTWIEMIYFGTVGVAALISFIAFIIHMQRRYNDPFNDHFCKIFCFVVILNFTFVALVPSMWPKKLATFMFNCFELGYEFVIYGIIVFYTLAMIVSFFAVIAERRKLKKKQQAAAISSDSNDEESASSEEIPLISH